MSKTQTSDNLFWSQQFKLRPNTNLSIVIVYPVEIVRDTVDRVRELGHLQSYKLFLLFTEILTLVLMGGGGGIENIPKFQNLQGVYVRAWSQ